MILHQRRPHLALKLNLPPQALALQPPAAAGSPKPGRKGRQLGVGTPLTALPPKALAAPHSKAALPVAPPTTPTQPFAGVQWRRQ